MFLTLRKAETLAFLMCQKEKIHCIIFSELNFKNN